MQFVFVTKRTRNSAIIHLLDQDNIFESSDPHKQYNILFIHLWTSFLPESSSNRTTRCKLEYRTRIWLWFSCGHLPDRVRSSVPKTGYLHYFRFTVSYLTWRYRDSSIQQPSQGILLQHNGFCSLGLFRYFHATWYRKLVQFECRLPFSRADRLRRQTYNFSVHRSRFIERTDILIF